MKPEVSGPTYTIDKIPAKKESKNNVLNWELCLRIDHESAGGGMGALNFEENAIARSYSLAARPSFP